MAIQKIQKDKKTDKKLSFFLFQFSVSNIVILARAKIVLMSNIRIFSLKVNNFRFAFQVFNFSLLPFQVVKSIKFTKVFNFLSRESVSMKLIRSL